MSGGLFWINRDASSGCVLQSSKEERSAIQSQVQRGRPRRRRPKVKPGQDVVSNSKPQQVERPKELYDYRSRHISVALDPFDSATVELDSTVSGLLRYYVFYYNPAQWPNEPFETRGPYTFKKSVARVVSTAVQDKTMMFCLLTSACCRLQYVDHLSYAKVSRNENAYAVQALQLLRSRVDLETQQNGDDIETLLQCITFMLSAESYRDNFTTARMHLKAALTLLEKRGGIMALQNKHLQEQLLMGDLFLACVDLQPCLCDCDYDPGSSDLLGLQAGEIDGIGDLGQLLGCSLLAQDESIVPPKLKELVRQINDVYLVRSNLCVQNMSTKRALQVGHWITRRNMAIRNKLLALSYDSKETNATRIALIMWTLLTMNITGRLKTIKIMAQGLQKLLLPWSFGKSELDDALVFWISIIGYVCSPTSSHASSWFLHRLHNLEQVQLAILTDDCSAESLAQKLKKMQYGYLYDEKIQGPLTEALAISLLALEDLTTETPLDDLSTELPTVDL